MNLVASFFEQALLWQTAQAIGFVGLILNLSHFQAKSRERLLKLQMLAALSFTAHFILLGVAGAGAVAVSGAVMSFLVAVRNWFFDKKNKYDWARKEYWLYIFLALPILFGFSLSWNVGIISALPALAVLIASYARWRDKTKLIRYFSVPASTLWLIYHIFVGSIPGTIMESLALLSLFVAIIRLDLNKARQKV